MKRKLWVLSMLLILMLCICNLATAEDIHHTVTFHSGDLGVFANGETTNVVEYGETTDQKLVTKYSHTFNIDDSGKWLRSFVKSMSYRDVVTIPGATSVHVKITYGCYSSQGTVAVYSGSHPNYSPNYSSSSAGYLSGPLTNGNYSSPSNTKEYDVIGDTVTFSFSSTSYAYSNPLNYGYYAVVTGIGDTHVDVNNTYEEPTSLNDEYVFLSWNTESDGYGTHVYDPSMVDEDVELYASYGDSCLGRGVHRNVDWKVTQDGVLYIGKENTVEIFSDVDETVYSGAWPWNQYSKQIVQVRFLGEVHGTGDMGHMFYGMSNLTDFDGHHFDTSNVTRMDYMFGYTCCMDTLDLSMWDVSSVKSISDMFHANSYSSDPCLIRELNLSGWDLSNASLDSYDFIDYPSLKVLNLSNMIFTDSETTSYRDGDMLRSLESVDTLILDGPNPFALYGLDSDYTHIQLPLYIDADSGKQYVQWTREDGAYGPYDSATFVRTYNSAMAGTWIRTPLLTDEVAVYSYSDYTLRFIKSVTPVSYTSGSYQTIRSVSGQSYTGYVFPTVSESYSGVPWRDYRGSVYYVEVVDEISPTTMRGWFEYFGCSTMDLRKINTSNVVDMGWAFYKCSSLQELNISTWDTSRVQDMGYMFSDCSYLPSIDVTNFDTHAVTDMYSMFRNCSSLTSLDLSSFDMSNVNATYSFLSGCRSLISITFDTKIMPSIFSELPTSVSMDSGTYFVSWVRDDNAYGPYSPMELVSNYTSDMVGTWVTVQQSNTKYAVYVPGEQCLYFIVSDTPGVYGIGSTATLRSVSGSEYTGRVYPITEEDSPSWLSNLVYSVVVVDEMAPTTMQNWFNGFSSCTSMDLEKLDTSNVVSMSYTFNGCGSLTSLDVSGFDTSNVTNMGGMFGNCSSLTELDVSGFDTSNVTYMSNMFNYCMRLESIAVEDWDVSKVKECGSMFNSCYALKELDLSKWDTSKMTYMQNFCYGCTSLEKLNISNWHFDEYVSMRVAFSRCPALTDVTMQNFELNEGGYLYSLFSDCSSLVNIDMSNNKFRVNGTGPYANSINMYYMFSYCTSLETVSYANCYFEGIGGNIVFGPQFGSCANLKSVDMSGLHLAGAIEMRELFYDSGVRTVDVSNWHDEGITSLDMSSMFRSKNLKRLDASTTNISHITNMGSMFSEATELEWVDLSGLDVSYVTNMGALFSNCQKLTYVNLDGWNPINAQNFASMFYDCYVLTDIDLSGWNTSNVTDMSYMFTCCYALENVDVSGWDTRKVTTMYDMFGSCYALKELDLSDFETPSLTSMYYLVGYNQKLERLDISNFDTSKMEDMSNAFDGCYRLNEVVLGPKWSFLGDRSGATSCALPYPSTQQDDIYYTGKWIRDDEVYGPYTPSELSASYKSRMAGTWVREIDDTRYVVKYVSSNPEALGSMNSATAQSDEDYQLRANQFVLFGYDFDCWEDDDGNTYGDREIIPAGTYPGGYPVTMSAVFKKRDLSIEVNDNTFEISLRANETAIFDPFPAGLEYKIYEQVPDGWELYAEKDSTGVIQSYARSESAFVNAFVEDRAIAQIEGQKFIDETPADAGSYKFELIDDTDGAVLQRTSVRGNGVILFDPLQYGKDDVGVHNYTVIERPNDDALISYDQHQEHVQVVVKPTATVYSHTDNLDDDGNRIVDVIDHSRDGEVQTVYSYSNNINADGTKQEDYESEKYYTDVVEIPGAASLHVKVTYSNVRNGTFRFWRGNHPEVHTQSYTTGFSNYSGGDGGYFKYYSNKSGTDSELLTDEFDVVGDAVTIMYRCVALDSTNEAYTEYSNYGYYAEISASTYVDTSMYREDGTLADEFEAKKRYADVITIPNAKKLHVSVVTNYPYGSDGRFSLWEGAYPQVYDTSLSLPSNPKYNLYSYVGLTTYNFDVIGDSVTVVFQSDAYPRTVSDGNSLGYGYWMKVTTNELSAEVIYDDDGAVFRNQKDNGFLMLSKNGMNDGFVSNAAFMYELSFFDEQGLAYDPGTEISYHSDFSVLPKSEINVYHIGVDHLGNEIGVLASERYVVSEGDDATIMAKTFAQYDYTNNDYTNDEQSEFTLGLNEAKDVRLYYSERPHRLTIKHMGINYGPFLLEEETMDLYCGDDIVIVPKTYDNYIYESNDYQLTASTELRGRTMPDRDVTITLTYDYGVNVTFGHGLGVEERSYKLTLSGNFTGLKTARYGDVDFVNGVATLTLPEGQSEVVIRIPSGTQLRWDPVTLTNLGYWRYGSSNTYSNYTSYSNTFTSSISIYVYSKPMRSVYYNRDCYDEVGNRVYASAYVKSMYPGEPFGTNGCSLGSTLTANGMTYCYVSQDPAATECIPVDSTDTPTTHQVFTPRIYITLRYIIVNDDGTERNYYTTTYSRGMNGPLHLSASSPASNYVFDSWTCVTETDSTFELVQDGNNTYLEGQLTTIPLTFEYRLKNK